jgi:hypothetical protein
MHKPGRGRGYLLAIVIVSSASVMPVFCQTVPLAADSPAGRNGSTDEVLLLKQQLAAQQKQIEQLQATMADMKKRMDEAERGSPSVSASSASVTPNLGQVASITPIVPRDTTASAPSPSLPALNTPAPQAGEEAAKPSPLSVKIGNTTFTPGGFMDFTVVGRSTDVGSGIGTSFNGIPFSGTTAGSLSETRFSMQNSRISLDVNSKFVGFDWHGHLEADFLGNAPANVFLGSNSNTVRSRLFWIDGRKGKFEFLGGQSWSMLTPNRNGLSANPSDIFYSQDMDTNYQVGLTWSRQAQFRLIYHPSDIVAAGISIEDQQQFVGSSTVPSSLASQVETGSGNPGTPNVGPDIIGKIAFDPKTGPLHQHIEIAGLLTSTRVYDPTAKVTNHAEGAGVSVNFNFELVKNLHAILNTFYNDGGGRYIFALGPQFIVDRDINGVYQPVMEHSGSGIAGFEYQINKATMLYGYYGAAYFSHNFGIDCFVQPIPEGSPAGTTAACNQTPSSKASYIGYGYPGSPNNQNKSIQEGTFGVVQTFWKDPHYGALSLITQYSYVTRAPWFVATGTPKNAHMSMGYVDLRYTLP